MLKLVSSFVRLPLTEKVCVQSMPIQVLLSNAVSSRFVHLTSTSMRRTDRRSLIGNAPKKDDGSEGEKVVDIDNVTIKQELFPTANTSNMLFDGTPFKEIPIINIKCSPNNTLMTLTEYTGLVKICHTCGAEGFKTARKGTNIAAQATAISLSTKALDQGYKTVRVRVQGLGPGRMSALKGLQMGGMNIISVTDYTKVSWCPPRPRKAKRL